MDQIFQNIATAISYTIGVLLVPMIILALYKAYQDYQQKKANTALWLEIFKTASDSYLERCEECENYREAAAFKQLMQSPSSQSFDSLRANYQLEYKERIFMDLESGEIKNCSYYVIKKNTS